MKLLLVLFTLFVVDDIWQDIRQNEQSGIFRGVDARPSPRFGKIVKAIRDRLMKSARGNRERVDQAREGLDRAGNVADKRRERQEKARKEHERRRAREKATRDERRMNRRDRNDRRRESRRRDRSREKADRDRRRMERRDRGRQDRG